MLTYECEQMLRDELNTLDAEQAHIDARRAAIMILISEDEWSSIADVNDDDTPAATFTAADTKRSEAKRRGGSKNRADISDAQLRDIRGRAKTQSHAKLAAAYGVSRATIGNIVRRAGCYA